MSHKIIKPEGIELIEYLNNGYAICNRCGAVMRQTEDPKTGCGIYICPSCGLKMDEEDYEYESDEEVEWTEEMLDMEQGDIPPERCDTIMKNQRSIYQCMGKYIFAIIRSIIAARYFKSEKRDWRLFSSDLMRKRRVPGGEKWTHGLQMIYICILALKDTLICVLEWLRTDFIRP